MLLSSGWKTALKLMALQGEVTAKMTECQPVYDLFWS